MNKLTEPDGVREYIERVAAHRGWVVNPDRGFVAPIVDGLAAQSRRLGKPYCPCRDADGGDSDKDIVCPCAYAAADIQACGQCYCGLFLAHGKDSRTVTSIAERRP